jgi:hypothetical protein
MTLERAREILNRARGGENISAGLIANALRETGDIGRCDTVQLRVPAGDWELEADLSPLKPAEWFDALRAAA